MVTGAPVVTPEVELTGTAALEALLAGLGGLLAALDATLTALDVALPWPFIGFADALAASGVLLGALAMLLPCVMLKPLLGELLAVGE